MVGLESDNIELDNIKRSNFGVLNADSKIRPSSKLLNMTS